MEGFPDRWVGRAFQCYEGTFEEVYGKRAVNGDVRTDAVDDAKEPCEGKANDAAASKDDVVANNDESEDKHPPYPKLPAGHQFVYLTGDSPNTLTTLDNNTTYIIGGIVDRNRLKRAALDRATHIATQNPALGVKTARLPLDENVNFKSATRVLTCNHVLEILLKYREKGYRDWKDSIMAVLPGRKDLEEKSDRAGE